MKNLNWCRAENKGTKKKANNNVVDLTHRKVKWRIISLVFKFYFLPCPSGEESDYLPEVNVSGKCVKKDFADH